MHDAPMHLILDEDKAQAADYCTRLGTNNTAPHPVEIQTLLCERAEGLANRTGSQDLEYDMKGGWVYRLRLFSEEEKPRWEEQLASIIREGDGEVVGAQWDMGKATSAANPPTAFEEGVKYRPMFLKCPR